MSTGHDNRLDDAPMSAVTCRRCAAEVLVRKSSWSQTSVQWNAPALTRCEERCTAMQLSDGRGLFLACSALAGAIEVAVRTGSLPLVDQISVTAPGSMH